MELPELVLFDAFKGEWSRYEEALYQIYVNDIVHGNLFFLGKRIKCQFRPVTHQKHFAFWHLISEGKLENERLPDLQRCERLRWIAYVIQHANNRDLIKCWQNKRGGDERVVLWLQQHDYVVILATRCDYFLLKTAYVISHESRRRKFIKEMQACVDPRKG